MTLMSLVNSISDQTFRFSYISWLFSEWDCVQTQLSQFRLKIFQEKNLFFWILAMTGWWSDDIFVRHGRECFQNVTLSITEWIYSNILVLARLYRHRTHHWDYTTEYIYQIKSSAVWEAHKKCLGNVLTLTCDLCLDIMAGGGPREGDDCDEWASSGWRSDAAQTRHMQHSH